MAKPREITDKKFNRLTAVRFDHKKGQTHFWLFRCDCGTELVLEKGHVTKGNTKSCGCLRKERFYSHGMRRTLFYGIYTTAKSRCTNPKMTQYEDYGGRGIKFLFNSFEEFRDTLYDSYLKHCQEYGHNQTQIDRINNNGDYTPTNVKWSTRSEQCLNRRPKRVLATL